MQLAVYLHYIYYLCLYHLYGCEICRVIIIFGNVI